jgi:hypothetical protein
VVPDEPRALPGGDAGAGAVVPGELPRAFASAVPTLEHAVRRFQGPPVEECFFAFSVESVRSLKATANAEMAAADGIVSSLLAHVWLAVTRARRVSPEQETSYTLALMTGSCQADGPGLRGERHGAVRRHCSRRRPLAWRVGPRGVAAEPQGGIAG